MKDIKVTVVRYPDRKFLVLRFIDPMTGKQKTKSSETTVMKDATKKAGEWESELREGRYAEPCKTGWADFRERYEAEVLPRLAPRTEEPRVAVMNHIENILSPKRVADLTGERLSYFESKLRSEHKQKDSTIAGHLGHLRSILAWALEIGAIRTMPKICKPTRNIGNRSMRGRPITAEEFDRLLEKIEAVRPGEVDQWKRYLTGLWLSGLRLEESLKLTWELDGKIMVDLSGKFPRFRIYAEAEKGHRDRFLPMTPDFAEWLFKTPHDQRQGLVFPLGNKPGHQFAAKSVSRIVSTIGEKAGVVVNKAEGKFASAHDLRRAFGTRWASKVKPATLQLLMRHATIQTTLDYYVSMDADDVAGELWSSFGNTSGNSGEFTNKKPSQTNCVNSSAETT